MAQYVLLGKAFVCPFYKKQLVLTGKYHLLNENNHYEGTFVTSTCPIIENSKLHKDDQCEEYKYLQCFMRSECTGLKDFPYKHNIKEPL